MRRSRGSTTAASGGTWCATRRGTSTTGCATPAYRFVGLLDGSRTVGEAWDLAGGQLADDAPTQPEVIQILSQLYSANLIDADITARRGRAAPPAQAAARSGRCRAG